MLVYKNDTQYIAQGCQIEGASYRMDMCSYMVYSYSGEVDAVDEMVLEKVRNNIIKTEIFTNHYQKQQAQDKQPHQ